MTQASTRLTGREIKHVITQGQRKESHFFVLYWVLTGKSAFKRAVIISKYIDKRAVFRNRLRRVINEFLRIKYANIKGINLAIKPKKNAQVLKPQAIRDDIQKLINQINR